MNRKIWVLGSSNIDITYTVNKIAEKGHSVEAESCTKATGGKGANQAAAAAHWGAAVSFIGAVGDDDNGNTLLEVLKSYKIDTVYVSVIKGVPSGNAVICVDNSGSNCIIVYPGANQYIPLDVSIPFKNNDILVAQLEVNMDAVELYFEMAKKQGAYTILNPSPFKQLSKKLIENTDMIVANESEAYEISGIVADEITKARLCAKKIMEAGTNTVVITLGKMGAVVASAEGTVHIPEFHVDVVDTQGAGDAFLGTFAAKHAQGNSLEDSALFANMVASLSVTKRGSTQISMPDPIEIANRNPGKYIKI